MSRILIRDGLLLTGVEERPVVARGYVLVEGDTIVAVEEGDPPALEVDETLDASDSLVVPGFVNTHTHLCMILGRNLGTDASLLHWLSAAQVPLMQTFEPEDYEVSMQLGAIENLKAGNTTVCEVFFSPHYEQEVDRLAARTLDASGIRSLFVRTSNDETFFEGFTETRAETMERAQRLIADWQESTRTHVGVGPLVPWASSGDAFRDSVDLGQRHDVRVHLHTAETPEYNELVRERTGKSNVGMLADVGALGDGIMLNHCVHLSDEDIGLIADSGTHVVHDPTSNMILASGVAPVPALRRAGVTVALACDGPACNNGQDMIETMKTAALLAKVVTRDPDALHARDVFAMATRHGARTIGFGDRLGSLTPGSLADIVLIDSAVPHLTPMGDPEAALVYSAHGADVTTVLVDGRVVVRDGEVTTLDEAAVRARARERGARARERASI
jgi:5-methylthioadenosine/S-adenosylhomocysteine deaminase